MRVKKNNIYDLNSEMARITESHENRELTKLNAIKRARRAAREFLGQVK